MAIDTKTTALAPFKDVQDALAPYKAENYHRLVPTALQERSPLFRPALAVVKVNAADPRDVYDTPGGGGTVCLHTQALERIGNALGIDWIRTEYERDPKEPFVVTAHVTAEYIDAVGQRRRINASATSDLRDGSITADVLKGGLRTARQFIAERTEARARNRVVRKVTGMPTSFRKDELDKPFVALRWRLDDTDPDVKRAIIAQGVGASDQIFGRPAAAAALGLPAKVVTENAGDEGPEGEVHEGSFREEVEGPEIPDTDDAPTKLDVTAIATAFRQRAAARPDKQKASDDLLTDLAWVLADVFGISRKDKATLSTARKGIASVLFGVAVKDMTAAQVYVVIEGSKDPSQQAQLASLADVIGISQPNLATAAQAL